VATSHGVPVDERERGREQPDEGGAGHIRSMAERGRGAGGGGRCQSEHMDVSDLLTDALGRVREQVPDLVKGLSDDDLAWRPDPAANPLAWLVWHLSRLRDAHVAGVAGTEQVWTAGGWAERFDLPFATGEHG